jgi:hypothetical protein
MLATLTLSVAACQAIAGIEDRTFDPIVPPSAACQSYCDKITANCTGDNQQYETRDTCLGICNHLPPGDPLEPGMEDTLACRAKLAEQAGTGEEPDVDCPSAGPGGNGVCGSNCESFCQLQAAICTAEPDCVAKCAGLVPSVMFNSDDETGDTLACRLYHISAASVLPDPHCMHATLRPNGPCDVAGTPPDCGMFCQLEMTMCTDSNAIYASRQECMAVCAALDPGTTDDHTQNTAGCRVYHSYNAVAAPDAHCPHTGPGGDGHCGIDDPVLGTGNCVSYCRLLLAGCPADYSQTFPLDANDANRTQCVSTCSSWTGSGGTPSGAGADSGYSLATSGTGNSVQCRLFHASAALLNQNDPTECGAAALGHAPCQ